MSAKIVTKAIIFIEMLSFTVSILHAKLCTIPCNRNRDKTIPRIWNKTE